MLPGDIVQRGIRATQILGEPLLQEAFSVIEKAYVKELRKCGPNDDDGRFRYAQAMNIIEGVKAHLSAVIAQGELTARQSTEFRNVSVKERVARVF